MRITRFRTTRAHGHLNLDIHFNSELTLLTGINGSGKTTAVRGLIALLAPSFRDLAGMAYDLMQVEVEVNGQSLAVSATRSDDDFTLEVGEHGKVTVPIFKAHEFEPAHRFAERQSEFYREQHTVLGKQPALEFLKTIPTPMFLDLERRGGTPIRRPRYYDPRDVGATQGIAIQGSLSEGLREAQEIAEEANRSYLVRRQELTDDLRNGLILMAFALERESETPNSLPTSEQFERLGKNYNTVRGVLQSLGIQNSEIEKQVDPFFKRLQEVVAEVSTLRPDELERSPEKIGILSRYFAMEPQERQIQRMVKRAETYNQNVSAAYRPIESYLSAVNQFLEHSGKRLSFSRKGRLQVMRGQDAIGPLSALSSGERQLVVILTHMAFNERARAANVLIIDEPELSLHIRWQEMFIDALRSANQQMQFIFATHSPSIIMERVESCIDLSQDRG